MFDKNCQSFLLNFSPISRAGEFFLENLNFNEKTDKSILKNMLISSLLVFQTVMPLSAIREVQNSRN